MNPLIRIIVGVGAVVGVARVLEKLMHKKVFVSFDYTNDKHYKFLLQAWHANKEFDFRFDDVSSGEIQTNDIGRVKAALATKIRDSEVTLVIVGKEANKAHRDRLLIGHKNWINFEISKTKEFRHPIVAVKIDRNYESPDELSGAGASWAMSFSDDAVTKALRAV